MEFNEAGDGMEMRVALAPAVLERGLLVLADLEPIHRDEHGGFDLV